MRICSKCNIEKENSQFYNERSQQCKSCKKDYQNQRYKEKSDSINLNRRILRESLDDVDKQKEKDYHSKYRIENSEQIKLSKKIWYESNKPEFLKKQKEYRKINRDRIRIKKREYYRINKSRFSKRRKEKLSKNILFKVKEKIRILIANSITKMGFTKKSRTFQILGISFE